MACSVITLKETIMTAIELACSIITRADNVQACKFAPRGEEAAAAFEYLGKSASHECFITDSQANYFKTLLGDNLIATAYENNDKFAVFLKTIWSDKKNRNYFLLVWGGKPVKVETVKVEASTPTPSPIAVNTVKVANHDLAATIIGDQIKHGKAQPDAKAAPGEEYLCAWIMPAQAKSLREQLPASACDQYGNITTQAAGSFMYWSKFISQKGAMLLCWMGDIPANDLPEEEPAYVNTGEIPLDQDIPF